jgi:hypothetical protein
LPAPELGEPAADRAFGYAELVGEARIARNVRPAAASGASLAREHVLEQGARAGRERPLERLAGRGDII